MRGARARCPGRVIVAHLLLAPLLPGLFAALPARGVWGAAYAPVDAGAPRSAVVLLHGMWSSPEEVCPAFAPAIPADAFLVCPRGNAPMSDGSAGKMWAGTYASAAPSVRAAIDAAAALAPGKLDPSGGTLAGYSNGAWFAAEIAQHEPGRWAGLVLLSMQVDLDTARLRAAGIARVVLAAGDRDMARAFMRAQADSLDKAGLPSRFVSLGPGGHELPTDLADRLREPIAWVRATPSH
jgi:predicted esterase